jgi:hypothetical protein
LTLEVGVRNAGRSLFEASEAFLELEVIEVVKAVLDARVAAADASRMRDIGTSTDGATGPCRRRTRPAAISSR